MKLEFSENSTFTNVTILRLIVFLVRFHVHDCLQIVLFLRFLIDWALVCEHDFVLQFLLLFLSVRFTARFSLFDLCAISVMPDRFMLVHTTMSQSDAFFARLLNKVLAGALILCWQLLYHNLLFLELCRKQFHFFFLCLLNNACLCCCFSLMLFLSLQRMLFL